MKVVPLFLALALGSLIMWDGLGAVVMIGGAALLWATVGIIGGTSMWRTLLIVMLAGYIVLSRGFAYISLPVDLAWIGSTGQFNVFIGEIVLLFCMLTIPHRVAWREYVETPGVRLLLGWMGFGLTLMILGLPGYGRVAVRDSAMTYYALFSYVGYAFARREPEIHRLLRMLGVAFSLHLIYCIIVVWRPVDVGAVSPTALGSDFPLFTYRGDAIAVNLAAGVLFAIFIARQQRWPAAIRWMLALLQMAVFVHLEVRAAYVGFLLVSLYLIWLRRSRQILVASLAVATLIVLGAGFGFEGELGGHPISPQRILEKIKTIVDVDMRKEYQYEASDASVMNVQWRLKFWKEIVNRGTESPLRFLFGRGFGPDLSAARNFAGPNPERPNRHPHNAALSVFARMGIIGLMLCVMFHVVLFRNILRGLRLAKASGDILRQDILTFLTAYVLMILGTSFFSVLLESPFMAIPYFFLIGVSLQLARSQHSILNRPVAAAAT